MTTDETCLASLETLDGDILTCARPMYGWFPGIHRDHDGGWWIAVTYPVIGPCGYWYPGIPKKPSRP